eukprot:1474463-Lingulodinium_polyedra.AAC.1
MPSGPPSICATTSWTRRTSFAWRGSGTCPASCASPRTLCWPWCSAEGGRRQCARTCGRFTAS